MLSQNRSQQETFRSQQEVSYSAMRREVDSIFPQPGICGFGEPRPLRKSVGLSSTSYITFLAGVRPELMIGEIQSIQGQGRIAAEIVELRQENEALRSRIELLERSVELFRQTAVDLSEMVLSEVALDDVDIVFPRGLRFSIGLSDDNSLFVAQNECLHIRTFGASRAELLSKLRDEIAFVWTEYACADDSELSPDAIELKRALRSLGEEVSDASQDA